MVAGETCTFVILGATGDLTRRKLIPAIYRLIKDKKITKLALVGVALDDVTIKDVLRQAKKFIKHKVDGRVWRRLENCSYYMPFNFYNQNDYVDLKDMLTRVEKRHKLSGNRVFYLATMPEHFATITENLVHAHIVPSRKKTPAKKAGTAWNRIVYEKPFGYDLASARKLNRQIERVFSEEQIYRIDHYLGKELVGDIALVRFTNRVFEPLWSAQDIDSVQIVLSEKYGIDGRGKFYDSVGALRDVMQNHMLQLIALVGMEAPKELSGSHIRNAKARVLKKIQVDSVVLGQYEGYRRERGVKKDSTIETFAAATLYIDNKRWQGVPFYLKTGKYLNVDETAIHIKFKMVKCLLSENCPSDSNYLTIRIQPNAAYLLEFNSKVPGKTEVMPVTMQYCHDLLFGVNTPAAYENLLYDVVRGDQSFFIRKDEIEASWKVIEEMRAKKPTVYPYKKGSAGPREITRLARNKSVRWKT